MKLLSCPPCCSVSPRRPVARAPPHSRAPIVEARTAEIFAGGCVMNSEAGTTGREACWRGRSIAGSSTACARRTDGRGRRRRRRQPRRARDWRRRGADPDRDLRRRARDRRAARRRWSRWPGSCRTRMVERRRGGHVDADRVRGRREGRARRQRRVPAGRAQGTRPHRCRAATSSGSARSRRCTTPRWARRSRTRSAAPRSARSGATRTSGRRSSAPSRTEAGVWATDEH